MDFLNTATFERDARLWCDYSNPALARAQAVSDAAWRGQGQPQHRSRKVSGLTAPDEVSFGCRGATPSNPLVVALQT
jgi:hypothetical protein